MSEEFSEFEFQMWRQEMQRIMRSEFRQFDKDKEDLTSTIVDIKISAILQRLENEPQCEDMFHTRCRVHDKVCCLIIDGGSRSNMASIRTVKKLGLATTKHPRPYQLQGLGVEGKFEVTQQVRVAFSIGRYQDEVLCDVVPIQVCHLLLGEPWQSDRKVIHDERTNRYSFKHQGRKITLAPLTPEQVQEDQFKMKQSIEREKEKEIEKEIERKQKENEKEKEIAKEKEIEKVREKENEEKKIEKEKAKKEIERELEKKSSEKERESVKETSEVSNHEKERNSFANPLSKLPCDFSLFQVCKIPSTDWFQLHYLSTERRFQLIERGKLEDKNDCHISNGKQGKGSLLSEFQLIYSHVYDKIAENCFCEIVFPIELVNFRSSIIYDFVSTSALKSFFYDKFVVGNFIEGVRLDQHEQSVIVCDKDYSHTKFDLFDYHILNDGDYTFHSGKKCFPIDEYGIGKNFTEVRINPHKQILNSCDKKLACETPSLLVCGDNLNFLFFLNSPCLNKSIRMRFTMYECLNICMLKFFLFHLCELLVIKKFTLHFGTSEQYRVFNPGVRYSGSSLREGKHCKFCLNDQVNNRCLYDALSLSLKTRRVNLVGLLRQNQIFDCGECCLFLFNRIKTYECLKACLFNFLLIRICDKTMACKMVSAFEFEDGVSNLPCYINSACLSKIDRVELRLHDHLEDSLINFDYKFDLILMHPLLPSMENHCEQVRSTSTFDPGIGLCILILNKILKRSFEFINFSVTNSFHFYVGDTLEWFPPKEGGHGTKSFSFQTICGSWSFKNNTFRIMNKRACDLEKFFASKWPDLRTNRLQEGGYDVISIASCCGTTRCYHDWPKHEGPKCKMKLNLNSTSSILVFPSSI